MSLPSDSHDSEHDQYIVGFISTCCALKSIPSSFLVYIPKVTINNGSHDQLLSCSCNCSS
jgi:hypothetical protein